jgi:phosphoribosylformimino-5-aminoimidazole carboxamide ribotide isomerase
MIAYPAIDLRGGNAVQLVGGRPEAERVTLPDPVEVAHKWIDAGFQALHVIDLDAALGTGDNRAVIREILSSVTVPVQVGGGVRDDAAVDELIEAGAARVIVGTRAIDDSAWRRAVAQRCQARIVVAADVRGDMIVTRGWTQQTALRAEVFLRGLADEPLAGVLVTDVGREGQMIGVDVAKFERLTAASPHALLAAGGIRDLADLRALEKVGVAGAVLGMALYTGAIDAPAAAGRL